MKLNNRGFAISSIMYIILVLAVVLIALTLSILSSRKLILDKLKNEALDNIYGKLPSQYQQVEYIASTGTQYINTQYEPNTKTKIVANIKFDNYQGYTSGNSKIFSSVNCLENRGFSVNFGKGEPQKYELFFWVTKLYNLGENKNDFNTNTIILDEDIILNKNQLEMTYEDSMYGNFSIIHSIAEGTEWTDDSVEDPLYIFGGVNVPDIAIDENGTCDQNNIVPFSIYKNMYLYDFKIYDDNILVRNFIPCYRKLDGMIGLYDLVKGTFYTNSGSGVFIKGNDM